MKNKKVIYGVLLSFGKHDDYSENVLFCTMDYDSGLNYVAKYNRILQKACKIYCTVAAEFDYSEFEKMSATQQDRYWKIAHINKARLVEIELR